MPELGSATVEEEPGPAPAKRVIHMIMADGSLRRLKLDLETEAHQLWIRGAATANGGEKLAPQGGQLDTPLTPREPLEVEPAPNPPLIP